ncbi:MAG: type VI secretion system tube protein Hcp [Gammaproteobacteria bacterium HGW-Gammaproteobacteria-8]|nr:MAG: type VI secretion system tube protein Hcp [Gammaproteobacteria bacterium HGW-Gammaproteobacteria-8]
MAVDMFLKFSSIKGDSSDAQHQDEVEVLSWSWGAHQSGTMHRGKGGGAGKVSVNDLSITKYVDSATPNLWQLCCNGKHENEAVLTLRKAGGDAPLEYLKITLEEVLVADMQTGGAAGEEQITESITLNFAKFKLEYTPQQADGSGGATVETGWDIRRNEAA